MKYFIALDVETKFNSFDIHTDMYVHGKINIKTYRDKFTPNYRLL